MPGKWKQELLRLYADLDDFIESSGPYNCSGCGECCHFDAMDHILYTSGLENRLLAEAPRPDEPDATDDRLKSGSRCPFQKNNSCLARDARPLGCRLFFCAEKGKGISGEECERWHQRLKRLHERLNESWTYSPAFPLASG